MADTKKSVSFESEPLVIEDGAPASNGSKDAGAAQVDEVTDMFKDLAAKKKKKAKKPKVVDFDAKLAEVDQTAQDGEPDKAAPNDLSYEELLSRFYEQLHLSQPDRGSASSKNLKIPPPQCLREGNKKTIFANLSEIAERLERTEEHITQFLFAEMGTTGSVDGSRRLVIKGRFQAKQIESLLRRYIQDYVSCKTCRSLNTVLAKGENRLWYITCQTCGSRRTVPAIKSGFSAQIGKRRNKQQG